MYMIFFRFPYKNDKFVLSLFQNAKRAPVQRQVPSYTLLPFSKNYFLLLASICSFRAAKASMSPKVVEAA